MYIDLTKYFAVPVTKLGFSRTQFLTVNIALHPSTCEGVDSYSLGK